MRIKASEGAFAPSKELVDLDQAALDSIAAGDLDAAKEQITRFLAQADGPQAAEFVLRLAVTPGPTNEQAACLVADKVDRRGDLAPAVYRAIQSRRGGL
jgi:hypothetical protein